MAKKNLIAFLDHEPPRSPRNLITGLARVGKSHLLRLAMEKVKRNFQAIIDVKITSGHADGRAVLREMLRQVSAQLGNAAAKKGVTGDRDRSVLEPLHEFQRVYTEAIAGHATVTVNESEMKGLSTRINTSLKSPGLPSVFGGLQVGADSTRQRSETESRKLEVPPLEEQSLCDLVSLGHELVRVRQPRWHTLLVIDDFDILRRSEDGSFDPVPLMQQLSSLAQVEGLHVLTTVRQDTFHRHEKSFYQLTEVSPFGSDDFLAEAYRRRVELYHGGEDPISPEVIAMIAHRTEGRIGVFFRWLRHFYDAPETDFSSWFWSTWKSYEKSELEAARCVQEAALRGGDGGLSEEEAERVRGTSLSRFLLEDYSSLGKVRVDPIALSFLRDQST